MKGRPRIAGMRRRLLDKSIEAYVLSLENINRLSITYRVESFTYLICNAWELLLKARVIQLTGNSRTIYYPRKRGERLRSYSLRDCLHRVFLSEKDPVRRNIELVEEMRDEATHLVIKKVPAEVLGLFQACVLNYHRALNSWFGVSLSERVPVGMMAIVYDLSPDHFDLSNRMLRKELGRDAAEFLSTFQAKLRQEFDNLGKPAELAIDIRYQLALTKKPGEADIVLTAGDVGETAQIIEVPKDPSKTHPFREKDLILEVNAALDGLTRINAYDIRCIGKVYNIKKRPNFFYQGAITGSPVQYSREFAAWLVAEYKKDGDFFLKARRKVNPKTVITPPIPRHTAVPETQADVSVLPAAADVAPIPEIARAPFSSTR